MKTIAYASGAVRASVERDTNSGPPHLYERVVSNGSNQNLNVSDRHWISERN